ncbi:MAG: tetratricopeptide repeat protein [Kofleriaceae bacterium]|nr:tetratricopeptide repeat protein [Kofleriaceae bacterium]
MPASKAYRARIPLRSGFVVASGPGHRDQGRGRCSSHALAQASSSPAPICCGQLMGVEPLARGSLSLSLRRSASRGGVPGGHAVLLAATRGRALVVISGAARKCLQAGMTDEALSIYEKVAQTGSMQDAEAAVNAMERIDGTDGSGDKSSDRTAYDSSSSDCISVDAINARLQQKDFRDPLARSQLFYELACAYQFDLQDINAAVGAYEDALKADPEHVQAIDALANIAYQQRDWARAHSLYQQVPTTMSSLPPSIVAIRKGEIAELIGQEEAALEAFQIAREFAPDNTEVLEGLVRCATRQGQFDDALSAQRSLVGAIPIDQVARLSAARLREAELCEKLENTEQTILSYEKLLLEETDSEAALSRLVPLYLEMERSQNAAAALRSLIYITPTPVNRAAYLFQLGEIDREEHSDPAVAADSYFKAIDLDPGHIGTLRRLLHYYCVAGDFVSAAEMARDLKKQFALLEAETGLPLLHRAAIACDISGDHKLAQSIWESFGDGATEEVAKAVRQTYRIDSPPAPSKLAAAIVANCKGTGDSLVAIREAIERNALDTDQLYLAELMAAFDS